MGNPVTKREADILDEYAEIMEALNDPEDEESYNWIVGKADEEGDW
jgi:hypothetical protein